MIPLSAEVSGTLTWTKISCRSYELKLNNEVVGTLNRPSFWSLTFLAETHEGRSIFRRGGFWGTGSEIVDAASNQQIATYRPAWGGKGSLRFADGQSFYVGCKGLWRPVWNVTSEAGQTVLALHRREKTVELPSRAAVPAGRLALLVMFAWYCMLRAEEDAASAASVAAVVAAS